MHYRHQVTRVLKEVNSEDCGEHQWCSRIYKQIIHLYHYRPTMEADATFFPHKCSRAKSIAISSTHLQLNYTVYLFLPIPHFDLVRLIKPTSKGRISILSVMECYVWSVEIVALKRAGGAPMANFIYDNVICRFGNLKHILPSNGTPLSTLIYRNCAKSAE